MIAVILGILTLPPVPPTYYYIYPLIPYILVQRKNFINESCRGVVKSIFISSIISLCLLFLSYASSELFTEKLSQIIIGLIALNFSLYLYDVSNLKLFSKSLIYYDKHPDQKIDWKIFLAMITLTIFDVYWVFYYFNHTWITAQDLRYINIFFLGNAAIYPGFAQLYIYRK